MSGKKIIEGLEQALEYAKGQPLDFRDSWRKENSCPKCGIEWGKGPIGYVCPNLECPVQFRTS
jgi:hypothetical protein